jgi:hypothetical protein
MPCLQIHPHNNLQFQSQGVVSSSPNPLAQLAHQKHPGYHHVIRSRPQATPTATKGQTHLDQPLLKLFCYKVYQEDDHMLNGHTSHTQPHPAHLNILEE